MVVAEDSVYIIGGLVDGKPDASLWQYRIDTGVWTQRAMTDGMCSYRSARGARTRGDLTSRAGWGGTWIGRRPRLPSAGAARADAARRRLRAAAAQHLCHGRRHVGDRPHGPAVVLRHRHQPVERRHNQYDRGARLEARRRPDSTAPAPRARGRTIGAHPANGPVGFVAHSLLWDSVGQRSVPRMRVSRCGAATAHGRLPALPDSWRRLTLPARLLVFGGQVLEPGQSQQTFFQSIYALSPFTGHWVDVSPEKADDLAYARCVPRQRDAFARPPGGADVRPHISCLLGSALRSPGHTA